MSRLVPSLRPSLRRRAIYCSFHMPSCRPRYAIMPYLLLYPSFRTTTYPHTLVLIITHALRLPHRPSRPSSLHTYAYLHTLYNPIRSKYMHIDTYCIPITSHTRNCYLPLPASRVSWVRRSVLSIHQLANSVSGLVILGPAPCPQADRQSYVGRRLYMHFFLVLCGPKTRYMCRQRR